MPARGFVDMAGGRFQLRFSGGRYYVQVVTATFLAVTMSQLVSGVWCSSLQIWFLWQHRCRFRTGFLHFWTCTTDAFGMPAAVHHSVQRDRPQQAAFIHTEGLHGVARSATTASAGWSSVCAGITNRPVARARQVRRGTSRFGGGELDYVGQKSSSLPEPCTFEFMQPEG